MVCRGLVWGRMVTWYCCALSPCQVWLLPAPCWCFEMGCMDIDVLRAPNDSLHGGVQHCWGPGCRGDARHMPCTQSLL